MMLLLTWCGAGEVSALSPGTPAPLRREERLLEEASGSLSTCNMAAISILVNIIELSTGLCEIFQCPKKAPT